MIFAEMGHWYPWATREYILKKMSCEQLVLYYRLIPESGRLKVANGGKESFKKKSEKPDLNGLKKLKLGKIIKR